MFSIKDWFVGLSTLESFVTYLKANELPELKVISCIKNPISLLIPGCACKV